MTHKELLAVCRYYLGNHYYYKKVIDQIREYTNDIGLTFDDIAKIITYWYDVKKADPSRSGSGIGIVPHIYKEALEYWANQAKIDEAINNFDTSTLNNTPKQVSVKEAPWKKPQGVYRFF